MSAVEATLSSARLARYLLEAKGDKQLALRLYIWNARLCEAFYLPTQFAEVAVRNAVHKPVRARFGEQWYQGPSFRSLLPHHHQDELRGVVYDEQRRRGGSFTGDHVIAGLSFGFWLNLLTSRYEKHLWQAGLRKSFPFVPKETTRQQAYDRLNQLRLFRNKVAHHYAIFDKGPRAEFGNTMTVIGWVCQDTLWLVSEVAHLERVLSRRPKRIAA